jgi:DNA-binding SARP family transcriptional activator
VIVSVLGQTEVVDADRARLEVGARKPRSVLAALALRHGTDTSADQLVDLVWGDDAPRTATGTLQAYISGLRRAVEDDGRPAVLVTTDHGYRLQLPAEAVDAHAFATEVREIHRRVSPLATQLSTGRDTAWPDRAAVAADADRLEQLLAQWRGPAYADLLDHPDVITARAALDELRRGAEDDRLLALLALGEHAAVLAATEQATARDPLRERAWALHALALTRSGRTADALAALRRVRELLADELGLDPGAELQGLERLLLHQDPVLQQWLPAPTAAPSRPGTPAPASRDWQAVGREAEESALLGLLDRAATGAPECALVVGEAGIGKSRLAGRVAAAAAEQGFTVAVGRCSQDQGAPPLWAWRAVLDALGATRDPSLAGLFEGLDEAAEFRSWDTIARLVRDRARERPVLVVLDDLHWADTSTLRVLAHLLTTTADPERLLVVGTRRPWPEPTGALAEVGEAFARRHGTRLDLTGLSRDEAAALVASLTGDADDAAVSAWHERAGGNPFYLVELARLGRASALPPTVRDVVLRRVDALPEETRELLLVASALGRDLSLDVLAAVAGIDPDEVDERLDPARAAGLLVDREPGRVAFAHALTRDAVDDALTPTRRARLHARVAHALETDADLAVVLRPEERVAELARHWLAAGPTHVGRAWRAALEAAEQARRVFSHDEAAALMRRAVEALRRDPTATNDDLYDALLVSARDHQRAAHWRGVVGAAFDAIALARLTDDPERMATAAAEISRHSVWLPHDWGVVNEDVIDDLRWALGRLPTTDSPARVQLMLALAIELYYEATADAEVRALVDEGVAAAKRLGDPRLLAWAARAAWTALWAPRFADERAELSATMLAAAREAGDEELEALALTTTGADALELGDMDGYRRDLRAAERIARRRRLSYVQLALAWEELTLSTMRGDLEEADRRIEQLRGLRTRVALPAEEMHEVGLQVARHLFEPQALAPLFEALADAQQQVTGDAGRDALYLIMARLGLTDLLRAAIDAFPLSYATQNWSTAFAGAALAESAAALSDPALARQAVDVLGPLSGRHVISGISLTAGPVDGYLACAEAVLGLTADATAHAEHAREQAEAWGLPVYAAWLAERRKALGF